MATSISALTNGQVKLDQDGYVRYFQNLRYTARAEGTELVIYNNDNSPEFKDEYVNIVAPASVDLEDLCDTLNTLPYFFKASGGGGAVTCVDAGTTDYSTLYWNTGTSCWEESTTLMNNPNLTFSGGIQLSGPVETAGFGVNSAPWTVSNVLLKIGANYSSTNSLANSTTGLLTRLQLGTVAATLQYTNSVNGTGWLNNLTEADWKVDNLGYTDHILLTDNSITFKTTQDSAKYATFIGAQNARIDGGVVNSVVLGGDTLVPIVNSNTVATPGIVKSILLVEADYAIDWNAGVEIYEVDTSTNGLAITITLSDPNETGRYIVIKDSDVNAAALNIIIDAGANLIDGSATYTINTNGGVARLAWGNYQWMLV